jgi:hypothetical protein
LMFSPVLSFLKITSRLGKPLCTIVRLPNRCSAPPDST